MPLLLGAVASVACGVRHQAVWEVGDCQRLSLGGGRRTVGGLSWVGEIGAGSPSVLGRLVGERGLRGVWFPLAVSNPWPHLQLPGDCATSSQAEVQGAG